MSSSTDSANKILACIIAIAILAASYIYMFGRRGEVVKADNNVSRVIMVASTDNANTDNKGGDITTTTASNEKAENTNNITTCANCGRGEESAGGLKACTACNMVKYCNRKCQIAHRPQHKKSCKKRSAELYDEKLFKEPPPSEECPICMLPLPMGIRVVTFYSCCGKRICSGCVLTIEESGAKDLCAYCRTPPANSDEEEIERTEKLMEKGNARAFCMLGGHYAHRTRGMPQDMAKANELYLKAGELGCAEAYHNLGCSYRDGDGVEINEKKAKHYYEHAAINGDTDARHNLGCMEGQAGNHQRAMKHLLISASAGSKKSLNAVKGGYMAGYITKDEYANTMREYQKSQDEMKSNARDKAAIVLNY